MSEEEVGQLFGAPLILKEYCVFGLLYGSGLRISEACNLRLQDIESHNKRLKVYQGKGAKDRYTLLPGKLLQQLRIFYLEEGRPKEYLFTSKQTKRAVHRLSRFFGIRTMQVAVNSAMAKAGFKDKPFTAHTLRHSFATHLLNMGTNLHVIKTLLGHSKLETTMVYLDLQKHTQLGIVSPLDAVLYGGAVVPMQRVHTLVSLCMLLQTGKDITLCPVCKQGRMELVKTMIYHNGCLVDAAELRNRGSPKTKKKYAVNGKSI